MCVLFVQRLELSRRVGALQISIIINVVVVVVVDFVQSG